MMGRLKQNKNKGFTLIELLVVIAIIGILAALLVIGADAIRKKSRDSRRQAYINEIQQVLERYFSDNGHYPVKKLRLTHPGIYQNLNDDEKCLNSNGLFQIGWTDKPWSQTGAGPNPIITGSSGGTPFYTGCEADVVLTWITGLKDYNAQVPRELTGYAPFYYSDVEDGRGYVLGYQFEAKNRERDFLDGYWCQVRPAMPSPSYSCVGVNFADSPYSCKDGEPVPGGGGMICDGEND